LWGCRVRGTKLPSNMAHWLVILRVTQVFHNWQRKVDKMKSAREQKRIREVAELVRKRESSGRRRPR